MRQKIVNLYQFDELNDKAKEKARDWFRERIDGSYAWESTVEDAVHVGLIIETLSQHQANKGRFMESAEETAHEIEKNHGTSCETYKTASGYLKARDALIDNAEKYENGDFVDQYQLDKELDRLDSELLASLLEDYRILLEKQVEYEYSEESVDENIMDNEYEFTEDGSRAR